MFNRYGYSNIAVDIITCEDPNRGAAVRHGIKAEQNYKVFRGRADFMLAIAAEHALVHLYLVIGDEEHSSREQMNWQKYITVH